MTTGPQTIAIELPLPPAECSPNFRGHTKRRATAVARYRQEAFYAYRAAKLPALATPITLHWDWYVARPESMRERYLSAGGYVPRDDDDAIGSVKAARDALIDAGCVPDDRAEFVMQGSVQWLSKLWDGRRAVVLRIELPPLGLEHVLRGRAEETDPQTLQALDEALRTATNQIKRGR